MGVPCLRVQGLVLSQGWVTRVWEVGAGVLGTSNALWSLSQASASLALGCCPEYPLVLESSQKVQVSSLDHLGTLGWRVGAGLAPALPSSSSYQGWLQPIIWVAAPQGTWASEANLWLSLCNPCRLVWTTRNSSDAHMGAFVFLPRSRSLCRNPW